MPLFLKLGFAVFLLSGFVSAVFVSQTAAALGIYKAYFIEAALIFIVVCDFLKQTSNYKLIIWSLVGSGLWIGAVAVLNQFFQYNPFNPVEFLERGRASAIYSTSNAVGLLLGPLIVLLFGYFWQINSNKRSTKIEKNSILIVLIILFLGLISSGSRGAYFGILAAVTFFFGYLIYFKQAEKIRKIINKLFFGVIVIFFATFLIFFININYFAKNPPKLPNNLQASFYSRLCLWEGAVNIIKAKPFQGAGLSNFQQEHANFRTCSQENSIYPHNIFLNFWTEVGFFGLISFLGICSYVFFKLLPTKKMNYLNLGLAAVFIEVLFHGLVDAPYFKNDLSVLFWVIIALSVARIAEITDSRSRPQKSQL